MKSVNATSVHLEKAGNEPSDAVERGRRRQEDERQLTAWQTARLYPPAVFYCSGAFTAGLMFGATDASGLYLPTVWTSLWTSLWTSMTSLAQALGAYSVGLVADRWGRKWPGAAAGTAIGAGIAAGTSSASEVAPLKLAAPMQASLVLFVVLMQGVGLGLVRIFVPYTEAQAFRNVFAIQWAVGFLAFVGFALTPEYPVYLIRRGKLDKAKKVLDRIYSRHSHNEDRVAYLIQTIEEEQLQTSDEEASYLECFRGTNLKRTLTVAFLYSTNNWVGAAFLAQSTYFLLTVGLPAVQCFDIGIGGFALAIIVIIGLGIFGHRVSKRRWLLSGMFLNFMFMTTIGAPYWAPGMGAVWAIGVLMNVLISIQTSLLQAIGWPIAAEISSYRLRAKTLAIGVLSQTLSTWLTQFVVPYMYNTDSGDLGAKTAFPFAGLSILVFICAYYCVPKTTGLTTEEIDPPLRREGASQEIRPEASVE